MNIQSLLEMKAEKVELREEIDTAVGEIGKSLQDVRMSLPPEGVMLKLRAGLREKANRSDLLKLRSKLNVLSGENDRDAPGLSKRCLSCDRPIVTSQESIDMITQANLALTQNMKMMTSMQSTKSINFGSHNRPESAGGLKSPNGNGNGNGIGKCLGMSMSKPCATCKSIINKCGIRTVYYSGEDLYCHHIQANKR